MRLRAIFFDCNGVISDDEPLHLELFQKVLREEGITLTRREYFQKYLALDDRSCFRDVLKARGQSSSDRRVRDLIARKAVYYRKAIRTHLRIFPGVRSFIRSHRRRYALGIVSGALRQEIGWIIRRAGVGGAFKVIVSAEDVRMGKPSPEGYVKAIRSLNRKPGFRRNIVRPGECLAIEDSIHGIESARKAGMKCLAVTNSYPGKKLRHANAVLKSLKGVKVEDLFNNGKP